MRDDPTRVNRGDPSGKVVKALYVHGGVSGRSRRAMSLVDAVVRGRKEGALDAVEAAARALEDDPQTNAGLGAVLNRNGEIELDAGIADGSSGLFGGVATVATKNPVSLARMVLEKTPHVLMSGQGAMAFASEVGMDVLRRTTDEQWMRWNDQSRTGFGEFGTPDDVDTVGAVALDRDGNLAAASSSGGLFGKMRGRVGDAAIMGAGYYATREVAVVGTGLGELFLEISACRLVSDLIQDGLNPRSATQVVVRNLASMSPTPAGLLALDDQGRVGATFSGASWTVDGFGADLQVVNLQP